MMWIVRLALKRPYTFVAAAVLVIVFGILSVLSMPVDVLPVVDIPVVSVIWQYGGLSAETESAQVVQDPSDQTGEGTTVKPVPPKDKQGADASNGSQGGQGKKGQGGAAGGTGTAPSDLGATYGGKLENSVPGKGSGDNTKASKSSK